MRWIWGIYLIRNFISRRKIEIFKNQKKLLGSRCVEILYWMAARPPGLGQEERDVVMGDFAETVSNWDEEAVDDFNEAMGKKMEED